MIKQLNALATELVGDGQRPDLFFVTDQGNVVTVTTSARIAYDHWRQLAARRPMVECALESRQIGCVATIEPVEDGSPKLGVYDDSNMIRELRQ